MECKIGLVFHSSDLKCWMTKQGQIRREITKKRLVGYIALTFPELYPHCHKSAIIESISDCSIPHEERMSICRLISL